MKKTVIIVAGIIIICILIYSFLPQPIPEEQGTIEVYFCPGDCEQQLVQQIQDAKTTVHCAFFDLDIGAVITALSQSQAEVQVIVDKDNAVNLPFVKTDTRAAYMHDKFCIFDNNFVFTGSMNPTNHDATQNNNNILFIFSTYLAKNYEDEFQQMWNGKFGKDDKVKYSQIKVNGTLIENFFCPEDQCEQHIAEQLNTATTSIYFMQFSFTSDVLGKILVEKSKTIPVKGIFEKSQNSQYSEYEKLKQFSILDTSSGLLHHKVFIIDNETVVTGSMNPSKNGNENNDENIIIIHNKEIAEMYVKEFERLT